MYIRIINDIIEQYSIEQLIKDNPQTSFPTVMSDRVLEEYNVYPLIESPKPLYDYTKNIKEGRPNFHEGSWIQTWEVTDASAEEISERTTTKTNVMREKRNNLLASCDWTQLSDVNINKTAWSEYRQALRDITNQSDFPWEIDWPIKPE
jgi:hypothetical protein